MEEAYMDDNTFNLAVRRFLKEVGITSQREIEKAVREGIQTGHLQRDRKLRARMTLEVSEVNLVHVVEGEIELG
jgi:Family of unknown function (DUF6494)